MLRSSVTTICMATFASCAFAQGTGSGSATLGGGDCAEFVAGQSVDDMIASAGSIEHLYSLSTSQIQEYDRWLVEVEKVMNQGVKEQDIRDLYEQGIEARAMEVQLSAALECRMGM